MPTRLLVLVPCQVLQRRVISSVCKGPKYTRDQRVFLLLGLLFSDGHLCHHMGGVDSIFPAPHCRQGERYGPEVSRFFLGSTPDLPFFFSLKVFETLFYD